MKKHKINYDKLKRTAGMNLDQILLPILLVVILSFMSVATSFEFLSFTNIRSMAFQIPELGLFSMAMMLAMMTGGIDLSVISTANFSGVIMALIMTKAVAENSTSGYTFFIVVIAIVVGLVIAMILGLLNGILVGYIKISPVLATLSTMILYEGFSLSITKGKGISGLPNMFLKIGNGSILGIPLPFIIFAIFVVIILIIIQRTPVGKYQVMIGSNAEAVEYSGINVKKTILYTYMLSGLMSGIASVIMISRINSANARFGTSYVLLSVLIAVLGGTNPEGGYVRVGGVILALFTLQILNSGINALGISQFVALTMWGVLLVLIIIYRRFATNLRNKYLRENARNQ
ncbi:MAG: sugar ABC transporter permease [Firmicutes bacterium HGW-Firmicutes-3]|nr:MAG: sugar ABC transporter permease [Firmicutes bacterium HGW-Firmicutes-3]